MTQKVITDSYLFACICFYRYYLSVYQKKDSYTRKAHNLCIRMASLKKILLFLDFWQIFKRQKTLFCVITLQSFSTIFDSSSEVIGTIFAYKILKLYYTQIVFVNISLLYSVFVNISIFYSNSIFFYLGSML